MHPVTFRGRAGRPKHVLVLRSGSLELAAGRLTLRQEGSILVEAPLSEVKVRRTVASLGTAVDLRVGGDLFKMDLDSFGASGRLPLLDLLPFVGGLRTLIAARRQAASLMSAVEAARGDAG